MPTSSCRPPPGRERTARSPTPTGRCRWAAGAGNARRERARTGGSSSRDRAPHRPGLELPHPGEVFAEMKEGHALSTTSRGSGWSSEERGHLSLRLAPDQPGRADRLRRRISRPDGPRQAWSRPSIIPPDEQPDAELPDDTDDRPAARALAHRRDDPPQPRVLDQPSNRRPIAPDESSRDPDMEQASASKAGDAGARGNPPRHDRARCAPIRRRSPRAWSSSPSAYVEAAANMLTNPALDPFGKIPEFKFCAARVERADAPGQRA